jgi:hypothetical protein
LFDGALIYSLSGPGFDAEYTEELEQTIKDLEAQLTTQTAEAHGAISIWDERCHDLAYK